uniref:NFACT RNA-binding domain-containing protein n=1 Tax=viral metagenome TaxID=1070528 RepID=A0A6C0DD24_9ZZZZ
MKIVTRDFDSIDTIIEYKVGTNAQENHNIIDAADPEDIWFHISGCSSCHVICKIPENINDKKILQKIAKQGAVICKANSKYKSYKNVQIDYTKIKNVTKLQTPGSVTVTNLKSVFI